MVIQKKTRKRVDVAKETLVSYYGVHFEWFGQVTKERLDKVIQAQSWAAAHIYSGRGKWARPVGHMGMVGIVLVGMGLAPVLANSYSSGESDNSEVLGWESTSIDVLETSYDNLTTIVSDKPRDKVVDYLVLQGDTLSGIAKKFGISVDTIRWENDLVKDSTLKPGQKLRILPVSGVRYKVRKGETIYSIAKKFEAEPQAIVDFPFNSFADDETFALAVGQEIIIPEGVMDEPVAPVRKSTPEYFAGSGTGTGQFIWPTQGKITQNYAWYHQGLDIANKASPNVLAADSGRVTVAGWPDKSGYGNRVVIDHGNGYVTLYGHLTQIYVTPGQYVNRGEPVGKMGTTGRSTGIHLHFEVRKGSSRLNPLSFLN